jgi:hypothetical protein
VMASASSLPSILFMLSFLSGIGQGRGGQIIARADGPVKVFGRSTALS